MSTAGRGMALGALGVLIFAMTLPMTRLAVGPAWAPQLPPGFVTAGRAAAAGLLSLAYLRWVGAARPTAAQDRKSTRLNSSHSQQSRMPSSA